MISEFVMRYMLLKDTLEAKWRTSPPGDYKEIIKEVVSLLEDEKGHWDTPCADRVHEIDDGSYQGTLIFVIGAGGYQPDRYWFVKIAYGSCSACDTFQACNNTDDYMQLALHVVQQLKEIK